jgi:hypothetical protein
MIPRKPGAMTYTVRLGTVGVVPKAPMRSNLILSSRSINPDTHSSWQMLDRVKVTNPKCMSCHGAK